MDVRPVTSDQFPEIYPLLQSFKNPSMLREDWRRMLFDLPWAVDEPHRGHGLYHNGRAVGFLGTLFSTRQIRGRTLRFCNLSSWIVDDAYRAGSFQLLMPV